MSATSGVLWYKQKIDSCIFLGFYSDLRQKERFGVTPVKPELRAHVYVLSWLPLKVPLQTTKCPLGILKPGRRTRGRDRGKLYKRLHQHLWKQMRSLDGNCIWKPEPQVSITWFQFLETCRKETSWEVLGATVGTQHFEKTKHQAIICLHLKKKSRGWENVDLFPCSG